MRMDRGEVQFSVCNITDGENMIMRSLCRLNLTLVRMRANMVRKVREYTSLQDIRMPPGYVSVRSARAMRFLEETGDPVLKNMLTAIRDLNTRIEQTEEDMKSQTVMDESAGILMTMPGLGLKSAVTVASAIDDVRRFDSPRKLVSYFGVDPVTRESAGVRKKGRVSKDGDALTRYTLRNVVIAHVYRFKDSELSEFFHRMKSRMEHSKAVMAAVRKLVCIIWAMLTFKEPFRMRPSE
jgi:transposase